MVGRLHELGVRIALGASRARVAGLVVSDAATVGAVALAAGIPLSLAAVAPLSSQLYGVQPNDPGAILLAVLLLVSVVILAAGRPARIAARVDPGLCFAPTERSDAASRPRASDGAHRCVTLRLSPSGDRRGGRMARVENLRIMPDCSTGAWSGST